MATGEGVNVLSEQKAAQVDDTSVVGAPARNFDKVLMLAATSARMAVGLFTFMVLARYLGPEHFGVMATAIAYATFIGIVTDYGLGVSAIRTASAVPARADIVVSQAFATKLMLTIVATVVAFVAAIFLVPQDRLPIFGMTYVGVMSYAFADLSMIAARAHRRFDFEALIVIATSIVMMLFVAGTAVVTRASVPTAIAFMLTRVLYLIVALGALRRVLGVRLSWRRPWAEVRSTLQLSSTYAADSILTASSSQVDVLMFGALLAARDIGVYQAGARLVQAIVPFATMLSTVHMPVLASAAINKHNVAFQNNARRVNFEFLGLALIAGLGFAIGGPIFTHIVYGERYAQLNLLWNGFGIFAMMRLIAAGFGIQLAALGLIGARLIANVAGLAVFIIGALWVVPRAGLGPTSAVLAASAVVSVLVLGLSLGRDKRSDSSLVVNLVAAVVATIATAVFLR